MQTVVPYPYFEAPADNPTASAFKSLNMQRMGTHCWRTLVNKGVPSKDARQLAIAIINFIYLGGDPSHDQQCLIERYHQHIRNANLSPLQFC